MENNNKLLAEFLSMFISPIICQHFSITSISQKVDRIDLRMEEFPELIPLSLQGKDVVLDGFCNELELQTSAIHDRAVFLHIFRRRWKEKGQDKHYSNSYDLHPEGVKATHEFAAFLKEEFRCTPEQYYAYIRSLHNLE
ncbi:MAG: hypothetical protein FWC98_01390 [Bacteroidales bacterium]|nr:hypothetical protein [Bacteroidales bacterium]